MGGTTLEHREKRRDQVATLMLSQLPLGKIAELVGCDRDTITADVKAIRENWQERRAEAFEAYRAEELAKLSALERAAMPKALGGDRLMIDRVLSIMERRAKMLGLDAPQQIAMQVISTELIELLIAQEELEIEQARRQLPPGVIIDAEVIDAEEVSEETDDRSSE